MIGNGIVACSSRETGAVLLFVLLHFEKKQLHATGNDFCLAGRASNFHPPPPPLKLILSLVTPSFN